MTADDLRTAIAADTRFSFRPAWIGQLGGDLRAIVEETTMRRLYLWPECTAWRKPLPGHVDETNRPPGETKPAKRETKRGQLSLF
jgi:hypothetical protein